MSIGSYIKKKQLEYKANEPYRRQQTLKRRENELEQARHRAILEELRSRERAAMMQNRPKTNYPSGIPMGKGYSMGINPNANFLGGSMFGSTPNKSPKKKLRPRVKVIYVRQKPRRSSRRKVVYY